MHTEIPTKVTFRFAWLVLFIAGWSFTGHAAQIETLFMPGKLIQGHAKFEAKCTQCHVRLRKGLTQKILCADCHKKVKRDISEKKGFHGKNPAIQQAECISCHGDHLGRDARIDSFNKDTFNHQQTDYPLKGAHVSVDCNNCHKPKKLYRETPSNCYSCHKKDDAHKGKLGKKCAQCHQSTAWPKAKFNHDKTKFPLKGRHKRVSCGSCHAGSRYKNTPKNCISCHSIDDAHTGKNGKKCQTCHVPAKWKKLIFNHDRKTKFKLEGRHKKVKCSSCHTGPIYKKKLKTNCVACHRQDDIHLGRNGSKCASCHTSRKWSSARFDHDKTKFPLRGKHSKISCELCHEGDVHKEKLSTSCYACHQTSDPHKGQQGKHCQYCHNDSGWKKRIVFDHDLTPFPLIGQHATVPCEECHLSQTFKDTSLDCVSCHKDDDTHKGYLGKECQTCHNPNDWRLWKFNHDTQTRFRLDGKHRGLECSACHKSTIMGKVIQSAACSSCHLLDDVHHGQFGRRCAQCHSTKSFKKAILR